MNDSHSAPEGIPFGQLDLPKGISFDLTSSSYNSKAVICIVDAVDPKYEFRMTDEYFG